MIPLSVSEISALGGFCDAAAERAGIGYSSSWISDLSGYSDLKIEEVNVNL